MKTRIASILMTTTLGFVLAGTAPVAVALVPCDPTYTVFGANEAGAEDLRVRIFFANSCGGSRTIVLAANTTYIFTNADNAWYGPNALPAIACDLTIEGNGAIIE